MSLFTAGEIIKRIDGTPFPDGKALAVVRNPVLANGERHSLHDIVYIEGGQWVRSGDVRVASARDLMEKALSAAPQGESVEILKLKERYESELQRRRHAEVKAAKANNEIEPMRQREAAAIRDLRAYKRLHTVAEIARLKDNVNTRKLALIKEIIDDSVFEPKGY